MIESFATKM